MQSKVRNHPTAFRLTGGALALLGAVALSTSPASARDLSFEDRVKAQQAIEKVYYSHQIGAKKSFEAAVPRSVLEHKVRTYLRQSEALEKVWNTPVTEEMLSQELQRMAQQSRMPERLRELYVALGNDVFLIEECLARPTLVGRMSRNFFAFDKTIHAEAQAQAQEIHGHLKAGRIDPWASHPIRNEIAVARLADRASTDASGADTAPDPAYLQLMPEEFDRFASLVPENPGDIGPLVEERDMFVIRALLERSDDRLRIATFVVPKRSWGEWWSNEERNFDAGRVRAVSSGRDALPTPGLHPGRLGGSGSTTSTESGTTSSSTPLSSTTLSSTSLSSVQVSPELLPADDTWSNGALYNVPDARYSHTAIWTGSEMIVWGGFNGGAYLNTGGRYNPVTDSWIPTSVQNAPSGRAVHTAVWTGSQMIVWGGYSPTIIQICPLDCTCATLINQQFNPTNTGGRYDPVSDTWQPTVVTPFSGDPAPRPRYGHAAVWSDAAQVMVVWGGFGLSRYDPFTRPVLDYLDTGGYYDPSGDTWVATPFNDPTRGICSNDPSRSCTLPPTTTTPPECPDPSNPQGGTPGVCESAPTIDLPTGRWAHSMALTKDIPSSVDPFTGDFTPGLTQVAIWGGYGATAYTDATENSCDRPTPKVLHYRATVSNDYLTTGWIYIQQNDVGLNMWGSPTSTIGAPAGRQYQTTVWTGDKMIVWGGYRNGSSLNTGGLYNPTSDSWSAMSTTGAPEGRYFHTAVWTGAPVNKMLIWGGFDGLTLNDLNSGGVYDPTANSWTAISTTNAPTSRYRHSAVWAGTPVNKMLVWGGLDSGQPVATGGRYDLTSDSWTPTAAATTPAARSEHAAVWTGSLMVTFGGLDRTLNRYYGPGDRYDPTTDSWTSVATTAAPAARSLPTGIWTGSQMVVWGGYVAGIDPKSLNPIRVPVNSGGRYDPSSDTWIGATSTTGVPLARMGNSAVWTGSQMIVWGGSVPTFIQSLGSVQNVPVNTGGIYSPLTDSWKATTTTGAPTSRESHSAVWTGSQMIVWGGYDGTNFLNSGGRYDPTADSWTATNLTGAPTIRREHAAVWTGAPTNRMVVWGGFGITLNSQGDPFQVNLNTGGRYDPAADAWTPTSTTNAPEARFGPSSTWTGSQLLVWGGSKGPFGVYPYTGGRYDPASDLWSPTSLVDVPSGRYRHSAVWTGNTLVIWGGYDGAALGSGGRYTALSGIAATYFRDADGDGCGDPGSAIQSSSQPVGYVTNNLDCNDGSTTVWSAPSEVPALAFSDATTLAWDRPVDPGAVNVSYDALRSANAGDFVNGAICVASNTVSLTAPDTDLPPPGQVFFYLIRAENGCPDGESLLGTDSSGAPRTGRTCP